MTPSYQWTSATIGVLFALIVVVLVRRDRLQFSYALWWLFIGATALVVGIFPGLVDRLGQLLGIHYPPILLVIVTLALLLVKSLTQDLDRCRREQNMRRMAQRLAVLESVLCSQSPHRPPHTEPSHQEAAPCKKPSPSDTAPQ